MSKLVGFTAPPPHAQTDSNGGGNPSCPAFSSYTMSAKALGEQEFLRPGGRIQILEDVPWPRWFLWFLKEEKLAPGLITQLSWSFGQDLDVKKVPQTRYSNSSC